MSRHSFSVISENVAIDHTLPKTRFFEIWVIGSNFTSDGVIMARQATEFSEIMRNNSHYPVQGHSSSGVTRNSGPLNKYPSQALLSLPLASLPFRSLPLSFLPFPFLPSPSLLCLPPHVLSFPTLPPPTYSQPFLSPSLPTSPIYNG